MGLLSASTSSDPWFCGMTEPGPALGECPREELGCIPGQKALLGSRMREPTSVSHCHGWGPFLLGSLYSKSINTSLEREKKISSLCLLIKFLYKYVQLSG